jgi:hypothetical protein
MNETATPVSETQRLADYLRGIGYPIHRVDDETKDETGAIIMIDTNPSNVKGMARAELGIVVDPVTKGRGENKRVELRCTIYATRWAANGRRARQSTFSCDDLSDLEADVDAQHTVARMVTEDLKLKRPEKVFDAKYMELVADLHYARTSLRNAEKAMEDYKAKMAERKVVPLKK